MLGVCAWFMCNVYMCMCAMCVRICVSVCGTCVYACMRVCVYVWGVCIRNDVMPCLAHRREVDLHHLSCNLGSITDFKGGVE